MAEKDAVCVLVSGGLDSCVLLARLAEEYRTVVPLFVRCGLAWEAREWAAVRAFTAGLAHPRVQTPVALSLPLDDIYGEHWSTTGNGTPDAATPDEAVYLAGRNLALLTKAAIFCRQRGIGTVALAPLKSNPFPDASERFFRSFEGISREGLGHDLAIVTPLADREKKDVILLGRDLPLEVTFSCLSPAEGLHCGGCNKCHERKAAFGAAGLPDPTAYAS